MGTVASITGGISRKSVEISVFVGEEERKFRLRSHSIAQQLQQFETQEAGRNLGLELAGDAIGTNTPLGGGVRAYMASICPVVVRLLSDPVDGKGPLTEAEFWDLDSNDPERVLATQEELTGMAAALGNGLGLLALAGRQILETLQQDGLKSEPPLPEPA